MPESLTATNIEQSRSSERSSEDGDAAGVAEVCNSEGQVDGEQSAVNNPPNAQSSWLPLSEDRQRYEWLQKGAWMLYI